MYRKRTERQLIQGSLLTNLDRRAVIAREGDLLGSRVLLVGHFDGW